MGNNLSHSSAFSPSNGNGSRPRGFGGLAVSEAAPTSPRRDDANGSETNHGTHCHPQTLPETAPRSARWPRFAGPPPEAQVESSRRNGFGDGEDGGVFDADSAATPSASGAAASLSLSEYVQVRHWRYPMTWIRPSSVTFDDASSSGSISDDDGGGEIRHSGISSGFGGMRLRDSRSDSSSSSDGSSSTTESSVAFSEGRGSSRSSNTGLQEYLSRARSRFSTPSASFGGARRGIAEAGLETRGQAQRGEGGGDGGRSRGGHVRQEHWEVGGTTSIGLSLSATAPVQRPAQLTTPGRRLVAYAFRALTPRRRRGFSDGRVGVWGEDELPPEAHAAPAWTVRSRQRQMRHPSRATTDPAAASTPTAASAAAAAAAVAATASSGSPLAASSSTMTRASFLALASTSSMSISSPEEETLGHRRRRRRRRLPLADWLSVSSANSSSSPQQVSRTNADGTPSSEAGGEERRTFSSTSSSSRQPSNRSARTTSRFRRQGQHQQHRRERGERASVFPPPSPTSSARVLRGATTTTTSPIATSIRHHQRRQQHHPLRDIIPGESAAAGTRTAAPRGGETLRGEETAREASTAEPAPVVPPSPPSPAAVQARPPLAEYFTRRRSRTIVPPHPLSAASPRGLSGSEVASISDASRGSSPPSSASSPGGLLASAMASISEAARASSTAARSGTRAGGANPLQAVICSNCGHAGVIQSFDTFNRRSILLCSCGSPVLPATPAQLLAALSRAASMTSTSLRPGASSHRVDRLPTIKFKQCFEKGRTVAQDDDKVSCRVCLCEFEVGDTLRILPCLHKFHQGCIDEWLCRSALCPLCNTSVEVAADSHVTRS